MKKILQKSLARLHALLLLAVMFVVGGSAAMAETKSFDTMAFSTSTYSDAPITVTFTGGWASSGGYGAMGSSKSNKIIVTCTSGYTITNVTMTNGYSAYSWMDGYFISNTPGSFSHTTTELTWSGTAESVEIQENTYSSVLVGSVVVTYQSEGGGTPGGGDAPATVNSTLNFASTAWNLSVNGETAVPTSGCHFDTRDVFTNADGVTMTLNNVASRGEGGLDSERKGTGYAQSWPNECFYSQYSTGYFALYLCNGEGFTINAPSGYNLSNIVVNRASTSYSMTSLIIDGVQNNDGTKGTWTGEAESVEFSTISGDSNKRILISNIQVTLTPIEEEGEVTYTIDLVDAPAGAYVTLDGQTFDRDNTYTVEKSLGKSDLEAYEPEGYYAEVEYTRGSHTYTVTYKAYNYYDVTVTGTTDPNAGIVYNETTYHNGDRIESKDVLTDASVAAANVANSQGTVTLNGNAFTVNYVELTKVEISTYPLATSGDNGTPQTYIKSGVTVQGKSYGSYLNFWGSQNITVSSQFEIAKIELLQRASTQMTATIISGGGTFTPGTTGVWTATNSTKSVELRSGGDYDILTVNVWVVVPSTNYTIDLEGAPAGASVRVNDDQDFDADGTYTTTDELGESNISVTCPDTHYYNVAYNEGSHTFTITFTAYNVYAVTVNGPAEGGVVYDGNDCTTEVKSKGVLTVDDVQPIDVAGYDAEVTFDGTTFTVTYTALPALAIGSSATDREGNYWTSFCFNKPVEFGAGVTPCIVTGANNGVLTVEEIVAEDNEYTYDLDFTTGAYSGSSFTAMDGKLNVASVHWTFNTGYGYAQNDYTDPEEWTTISFTLADDFNGTIKSIRFLTAYDTNSDWFEYTGGSMNEWSEIPVNGKTMTLGAWYGRAIKHFYLDIVEPGDAPVFPANTAVLLKSDVPGAVTYYTRPAGNVDVSANILSASGETGFNVSNDADHLYYKLTLNAQSEAGSAGFYWGVEGGHSISVPAHKAYLKLDTPAGGESRVRAFLFGGDDTTTGIDAVESAEDAAPVFNLQGQRVNAAKAGVYVKNGRKFIVK